MWACLLWSQDSLWVSRIRLSLTGLVASTFTTESISPALTTVLGSTRKDTLWRNRHQQCQTTSCLPSPHGPVPSENFLNGTHAHPSVDVASSLPDKILPFQTYSLHKTSLTSLLTKDFPTATGTMETIQFCNLHKRKLLHGAQNVVNFQGQYGQVDHGHCFFPLSLGIHVLLNLRYTIFTFKILEIVVYSRCYAAVVCGYYYLYVQLIQ